MNKIKTCREIILLLMAIQTTFRTKLNNLFHYTTVIVQKNPDFGYQSYDVFDLANINSADCKAEFRVKKEDLPPLQMSYIFPH